MNEVSLSAEELKVIKQALRSEYVDADNRQVADKVIRKIDILLKEPGDEGGFIGIELGGDNE